ncbi:MAG: pyridoxal phosphate-dependent decarboxylase family protein [Phycisphaerae bacterium]
MTAPLLESLLLKTAKLANDYLQSVGERPVAMNPDRAELQTAFDHPLPDHGEATEAIIESLHNNADPGIVASTGGRYFGFVIGASLPVSVAADWLVSAWDQNAGFYVLSPAAAVIEEVTGKWIKGLLGLPAEAAVGFVTGCQMANFLALASARQAVLEQAGWDAAMQGLAGAPPIRLITSEHAHGTIDRAFAMLGLGAKTAIRIPCDEEARMNVDALANVLSNGRGMEPTIVCAQAGDVNTGAFDDFVRIAQLCKAAGAWLHVDGAFGLWAAASNSHQHLTEGVQLADSWATDAHKWLNVPYDSGVVMVRHPEAMIRSTRYHGDYLVRMEDIQDPCMFTPESSRRARAIPLFAALKSLGRTGVERLVERCCERARQMAHLLSEGGLFLLNDVVLNQVLVCCPPPYENERFHDALISRIQKEGTCWLGGTMWNGQKAIRISVCSYRTTPDDIEQSAAAILRCYEELKAAN